MKLSCQIVQDLLPLYLDEVCSEESRRAVEGHLRECEACRERVERTQELPALALQPEPPEAEQVAVRSLKRVRRRWLRSLIAALLILPVVLLGVLGYNQYRGRGICFANLDELVTASGFAGALAAQNYEETADFLDFSRSYQQVTELLQIPPERYMPELVEVTIGEERWIAERSFAEYFLTDTADALQTWMYLAHSGLQGILIPEDIWDLLIREDPTDYWREADGTECFAGNRYLRLETDWGTFLVDELSLDVLTEEELAHFICIGGVTLLPAEIYQALKQEIEEIAAWAYQDIQTAYADVAGMTLEEYCDHMRKEYAQGLEQLERMGFSVEKKGFRYVSRGYDGSWCVEYAVEVTAPEGTQEVQLIMQISGSRITAINTSYFGDGSDWLDLFVGLVFVA